MVLFIVGRSGSGKSYLAKQIVREILPYRKVVVINNNPEYVNEISGMVPFVVDKPHKYDWNKVISSELNPHIELLVNSDEINGELDEISEAILTRGNTFLVIDEARLYYPQYKHSRGIEKLINTGRKFKVDTMFVSQIAVLVNRTVDSQVTFIICFQTTRKAEVERMRLYFGDDADQLSRLNNHQFMICDFLSGDTGIGRL